MENKISRKLLLISKLYEFKNNNLKNCEKLVNKVNIDINVNEINNHNSVKILRIGVKKELCFDVNEEKQRQCYKQLKCFWPKCRYSCDKESHLNRHILYHLNEKQFVCNECNKLFEYQCDLIEHKNSVHSKSFVCSINNCHKKFRTKRGYLYHKNNVHSTDRPFVCPRSDCNKRFKTEQYLIYHKRNHSSIKRFECDICHKRLKTKIGFRYHKSIFHSNDRPFECPRSDCDKRFKIKSYLQYHESTHSSVKNFGCDECDKRFKTNINLKYHKKRNHIEFKTRMFT